MKTSMHDTAGIRDVRTPLSSHIRSLPHTTGGGFLELFSLAKEQERLAQEKQHSLRRLRQIHQRLRDVAARRTALKASASADGDCETPNQTSSPRERESSTRRLSRPARQMTGRQRTEDEFPSLTIKY